MNEWTRTFKGRITGLYNKGWSIEEIAEKLHIEQVDIVSLLSSNKNYFYLFENRSRPLGHKSEPYYTKESDMLELPTYLYEELSPQEKEFYESRISK